jgi:hypothetical protein
MSSKRRRAASRANGKKSQGPVTPEGKARSAANATRHGLAAPGRFADTVCLTNESQEQFTKLHAELIGVHAPANVTEELLVEEMAVARWRLQRAWAMESALLDNQMDNMTTEVEKDWVTMDETTRTTLAFRDLCENSPTLQILQRYESRLSRQFERCLKRLGSLRSPEESTNLLSMPSDPNPKNGHHENADQLPIPTPNPPAQRTKIADAKREPAIVTSAQASEVDGFHPRVGPSDPDAPSGPAPSLPRAA